MSADFSTTALNEHNRRVQGLVRLLFLVMTVLLILPVVIILQHAKICKGLDKPVERCLRMMRLRQQL